MHKLEPKTTKLMAMGSYLSIITLNVNGLNMQPKDRDWLNDTKTKPLYMPSTETHLKTSNTYRLKVKGWKKIFHANRDQKKAGVATLISDKIDFIFFNFILFFPHPLF